MRRPYATRIFQYDYQDKPLIVTAELYLGRNEYDDPDEFDILKVTDVEGKSLPELCRKLLKEEYETVWEAFASVM
jgi:hypothetical protein